MPAMASGLIVPRSECTSGSGVDTSPGGTGTAFGTCGELVQGQFKEGTDFLITLPINLGSEVQAILSEDAAILVSPPGKVKTARAVRLTLDLLGCPHLGARIAISSALPEGKGMASSTADIVAACNAVAEAAGTTLSSEQISGIARQIEPSDGVMYAGSVCYDHRRCVLLEALGPLPPATLLVVDLGGRIDTLAFNRQPKEYTTAELEAIDCAYQLAVAGVQKQSLALLGQAATLSARVNQRLLPKPQLETLIALATHYGAYGVCVAHSGTVAGIIFNPEDTPAMSPAKEAARECLDLDHSPFTTTTSGEMTSRHRHSRAMFAVDASVRVRAGIEF